jgi:hypothetical protein
MIFKTKKQFLGWTVLAAVCYKLFMWISYYPNINHHGLPEATVFAHFDAEVDAWLAKYFPSTGDLNLNITSTLNMQNYINCLMDHTLWQSTHAPGHSSLVIDPSCTPPTSISVRDNHEICKALKARILLFAGPEQTYHLHLALLNSVSLYHDNQGTPHVCPSPEFCTFHHICRDDGQNSETIDESARRRIPPTHEQLVSTGSSLLRYRRSYSLHTITDPFHPIYTSPQIHPETKVRMHEAYWAGFSRSADVLVIHRAPIPLPANLTSVLRNMTHEDVLATARNVTQDIWIPSISENLENIKNLMNLGKQIVVWHGAWYVPALGTLEKRQQSIFRRRLKGDQIRKDNWALYWNAQGLLGVFSLFKSLRLTMLVNSVHAESNPEENASFSCNYLHST